MMTHDVNAAVRGARAAGASEIVIKDSHGSMKNLLIDELEAGVQLVSGFGSGHDGMMQGIDESFDAALLIGYHAMAGTLGGIMEHTYSGGCHRLLINGQPAGEIALSAGIAATYGVPIAMISSDEAGCREAAALIPGLTTFTTKFGIGRYLGRLLHPSETGPGIEAAVQNALKYLANVKPWLPSNPVVISTEFNRSEDADSCAQLVGVNRIDAYTCEGHYETFHLAQQGALNMLEVASLGANANR